MTGEQRRLRRALLLSAGLHLLLYWPYMPPQGQQSGRGGRLHVQVQPTPTPPAKQATQAISAQAPRTARPSTPPPVAARRKAIAQQSPQSAAPSPVSTPPLSDAPSPNTAPTAAPDQLALDDYRLSLARSAWQLRKTLNPPLPAGSQQGSFMLNLAADGRATLVQQQSSGDPAWDHALTTLLQQAANQTPRPLVLQGQDFSLLLELFSGP